MIKRHRDFFSQCDDVSKRLNEQHAQLRMRLKTLQTWEAQILKTCALHIANKEKARARIYANELVEIHKTLAMLQQAELIVEALRLRMATARELGQVSVSLKPLTFALVQVKSQLQMLVPEAARGLDAATQTLASVLSISTPDTPLDDFTSSFQSEGVEEVLREVAREADVRLRQSLDNLDGSEIKGELKPLVDYVKANGMQSIKSILDHPPAGGQMESHPRGGSAAAESSKEQAAARTSKSVTNSSVNGSADGLISVMVTDGRSDLAEKVYAYIKSNRGYIDVSKCSREFGVDKSSIKDALKDLEATGRIKLDVDL